MRPLIARTSPDLRQPSDSLPPFLDNGSKPPQRYRMSPLHDIPEDHGFHATALNDRGDVVGNLIHPHRFEGDSWESSGLRLPKGLPPQRGAECATQHWPYHAVSSNGLIAGTTGRGPQGHRAWASHLGVFGECYWPDSVSIAQAVNAHGVVVGKTLLPAAPLLIFRAFVMGETGRPRFLTPPEGGMTDAIAINDRGTLLLNVTKLTRTFPREHAWIWQDDVWEPLETPPHCASVGTGLTAEGRVVGYVETEQGLICAAVWVNGRLSDLGTPLGAGFRPVAGNDLGHIVGNAVDDDDQPAACRWTPEYGLEFLRDLLVAPPAERLVAANGINLSGQIIASTKHGNRMLGCMLEPARER